MKKKYFCLFLVFVLVSIASFAQQKSTLIYQISVPTKRCLDTTSNKLDPVKNLERLQRLQRYLNVKEESIQITDNYLQKTLINTEKKVFNNAIIKNDSILYDDKGYAIIIDQSVDFVVLYEEDVLLSIYGDKNEMGNNLKINYIIDCLRILKGVLGDRLTFCP